jgi:sialidase-1
MISKIHPARFAVVIFLFAAAPLLAAAPLFESTDVYVSGKDGYFGYRIPAIEVAKDGTVLAFAEARKYNLGDPGYDGNDIDLVVKSSSDRGKTWSHMRVIEDPGEKWSAANPATIVERESGRIWLIYLQCKPGRGTDKARPGTDDSRILARTSDDSGRTWSEPIDLTLATRDMADPKWRCSVVGPGGAIQTRGGRLLLPVWRFEPFANFTTYSEDRGKTWRRGEYVPDLQGDECELVELADGKLLLDIRQQKGPHRFRSTSDDGGRTWSKPFPGEKVDPVACAIERFTLKSAGDDRDRILWTGPKGPGRSNLVVRASYDEGRTFPHERAISSGHAAYSDLAVLADRTAGVLWERGEAQGYQFITFTRFDRDWLEPSGPPPAAAAAPSGGKPHIVISRGEAAGSYQAFTDICRLKGGDLLCVFYAGYGHVSLPKPDCPKGGRICMVRSSDEGRTWTAPKVLFDGPHDDRDPHIAQMRDGTVLCSFFTYRPQDGVKVDCDTCLVESRDGGATWGAEPRTVAAGWPSSAPVRELPDGTRLLGIYREEGDTAYGGLIRSTDGGKTWSDPIPIGKGSGVRLDAETDFVLLKDGALLAALRGDRVNLHFATSRDQGLTWSPVKDSGFPGHCPHFTRLSTGEILLVHRLPATSLHWSRDEGATWVGPVKVDDTIGAYPSTIELVDGTVLIIYYEEGGGSAVRARRFRMEKDGPAFIPWE